jgi:hypothetical protein
LLEANAAEAHAEAKRKTKTPQIEPKAAET